MEVAAHSGPGNNPLFHAFALWYCITTVADFAHLEPVRHATSDFQVKNKMDTSGIEPDPSRKFPEGMLSERDNQLHHVPSLVDSPSKL